MQITDIKVYVNNKEDSKILAYATMTIYDEFVVTGIKVFDGKNGYFASMPSRKDNNNEYKDICYPRTKYAYGVIQEKVIEAYLQATQATAQEEYSAPIEPPRKNEAQRKFDSIDVDSSDLPF